MISGEFLDQLNRFSLIVNKRVTSHFVGSRESLTIGHGLTFEDHREYVPGDDFRSIDWRVYGRTDRLHVRRFEEEKSLTVFIATDASASMKYKKKWDYASMLSIGFAFLAVKDNEKFQFATYSERLQPFRSKRGRQHLALMIEHLNHLQPEGQGQFLKHAMRINKLVGSRSLVVLISDFLYDIEEVKAGLLLLSKHDVKVIQLFEKDEVDLPLLGEYRLKDAETGTQMKTFVSKRYRNNYIDRLKDHNHKIQKLCNQIGLEYIFCHTGEDIFDIFYRAVH